MTKVSPYCPHGFSERSSCADCRGIKPEVVKYATAAFPAAYEGHCIRCEDPIIAGDQIRRLSFGGAYVHADCQ